MSAVAAFFSGDSILFFRIKKQKSRNLGIALLAGCVNLLRPPPLTPIPFWSSFILVVFHFGRLPFWSSSILVVFHFGHLPFWSFSILVVFHFGRLPIWSTETFGK